jgi:hypothetical protein
VIEKISTPGPFVPREYKRHRELPAGGKAESNIVLLAVQPEMQSWQMPENTPPEIKL